MEVKFNLCPIESDVSAPHWTLLLFVAPQGCRVLGKGWVRDTRGPDSSPKFTGTLSPDKLVLFVLHRALVSKYCSMFV